MNWANWVQTVRTQPGNLPALLDEELELKSLGDQGRARALIQAMQNRNGDLFFLEGEEEGALVVFRHGEDWYVRRWNGDEDEEIIAEFINYTRNVAVVSEMRTSDREPSDYYSLRPLIYGGRHWLETITRNEINRFEELGSDRNLSVMLIAWRPGHSLFELVESLRRGDRVGYFERMLGVVLPFTSLEETEPIRDRLERQFRPENIEVWGWDESFDNHFDLKTRVEEYL